MRIVFIYNPDSEVERNNLATITEVLPNIVSIPFMEARDIYQVSNTPALILELTDASTTNMFDVDQVTGNIKLVDTVDKLSNLEE